MRMTKKQRGKLWADLDENFRRWKKMSDDELLQEAKRVVPALTEATRDECLQVLVMWHAEKMVD